MQNVQLEVRKFVFDNFFFIESNGNLSDDDSFLENGVVDSLGILTLVTFVQKKYNILVEENELLSENWDSVNRIAAYVERKLGSSGVRERDLENEAPVER
jgi:acyl carrier protein